MRTTTRIISATGVAAPALWAATVLYLGAIRPGYDPVNQFMSELAERGSSTEVAMRVMGFCLPGLLVVLFGVLLLSRSTAVAVAVLVIIHGAGRVVAGVFPCDVGCPMTNPSFSQTIHNIAAMINGLTLPAAALLWSSHLWKTRRSRHFAWYSLTSGILGLAFLSLMIMSFGTRHNVGLFQRLSFGVVNLWLAALAVSFWRSGSSGAPSTLGEQARPT